MKIRRSKPQHEVFHNDLTKNLRKLSHPYHREAKKNAKILPVLRIFVHSDSPSILPNIMTKTNACRILDQHSIPYEVREYEVNEDELDAVTVAHKIGLPPEQVFKTLVLTGDTHKHFVAVIPGNAELDLKRTARSTGNKSCAMLPMKELLPLTGYIRGGCSPIGMKKPFPTFLDETVELFDRISISPGKRGMQILLAPAELQRVTGASIVELCA